MVWDPEQYLCGNYFQNEVNEIFRKRFIVEPFGSILDIGCGDGRYSCLVADHIKHGEMLGIDSSVAMVQHANEHWARENLAFDVHNIEQFQSPTAFDFALSFWCLHWTKLNLSLPNIYQLLKHGGRMYAVFSSFSGNSILQTWHELAKKNLYREFTARHINPSSQNKNYFYQVVNIFNQLPFKQVKLTIETIDIYFPNIDYFRNLLLTMPFMKSFPAESIEDFIEAMLNEFQSICQRKYGGALYYQTRPIFLEAIK